MDPRRYYAFMGRLDELGTLREFLVAHGYIVRVELTGVTYE